MNQNRTEWVMHVWGKKRDTLELNDVEKFHIDMLSMLQDRQMKFDKILVNIAMDDIEDTDLFNLLKSQIDRVIINKNVEYKMCKNEPDKGEYVTFKPYVFDRIGENVDVFYSHFKGYSSYFIVNRKSYPKRVSWYNEMFWSYIMYRYSLNMNDVKKNLKNNSTYFWTILKCKDDEYNGDYYKAYRDKLLHTVPELSKYITDNTLHHSPGSFGWYNLKNIGKSLADKPEVRNSVDKIMFEENSGHTNLCTHFCELYLTLFLDEKECYSVNDYNDVFKGMTVPMYVTAYTSKKFGRELLQDFEKYLMDVGLI